MSTEACSVALSNMPDIARSIDAFYVLSPVISTSIVAEMFQMARPPCGMQEPATFVTPELQVVEYATFRRNPLSGKLWCADLELYYSI